MKRNSFRREGFFGRPMLILVLALLVAGLSASGSAAANDFREPSQSFEVNAHPELAAKTAEENIRESEPELFDNRYFPVDKVLMEGRAYTPDGIELFPPYDAEPHFRSARCGIALTKRQTESGSVMAWSFELYETYGQSEWSLRMVPVPFLVAGAVLGAANGLMQEEFAATESFVFNDSRYDPPLEIGLVYGPMRETAPKLQEGLADEPSVEDPSAQGEKGPKANEIPNVEMFPKAEYFASFRVPAPKAYHRDYGFREVIFFVYFSEGQALGFEYRLVSDYLSIPKMAPGIGRELAIQKGSEHYAPYIFCKAAGI